MRDTDGNIIEKVDEEETDADKSKVDAVKPFSAAMSAQAFSVVVQEFKNLKLAQGQKGPA